MMAKIVKGSGAKGIVDYILDKKKQATLIDCQGVLDNYIRETPPRPHR